MTNTKKSTSTNLSGPASTMAGRILDDTFIAADNECAAGFMCCAQPPNNTFNAGHKCYVCNNKLHLALLCGMGLDAYINKYPLIPINYKCVSGNVIVRGDDSNEMRAVCFRCINLLHDEFKETTLCVLSVTQSGHSRGKGVEYAQGGRMGHKIILHQRVKG